MAGQKADDDESDATAGVVNIELTRWAWSTVHSALATANHRRRDDGSAYGEEAESYEVATNFRKRLWLATGDMNRQLRHSDDQNQTFMMAVTPKIASVVVDALREERDRHRNTIPERTTLKQDAAYVALRVAEQTNVEADWLSE